MIGAADFFKRGYHINARFKNVQEFKKGDPVKMAGVEIGRVEEIELDERPGRGHHEDQRSASRRSRPTARAVIKFTGLMGQNFVAIEGGSNAAPHRTVEGRHVSTPASSPT